MKATTSVQVVKGVSYNFEDISSLLGKQPGKRENSLPGTDRLKDLYSSKSSVLRQINDWKDCPASYRSKLHRKLQNLDV